MHHYQAMIIGGGLAGLATAVRLTENNVTDLLIVESGPGGTPSIAAVNFVLPGNPYGDTPEQYAKDMLAAGYGIGRQELVRDMAACSVAAYEMLRRCGVQFAMTEDGALLYRHLSGHSHPRSLCQTDGLIGGQMRAKLRELLKGRGVTFLRRECVRLLSDGGRVYGATLLDRTRFNKIDNIYASAVIAAWGGVGHLFPQTTYPADVNGRSLAMAYRSGAALCDLEFVEYEPMVMASPEATVGEPCPTAMLGEGAHLVNSRGERFLLAARPQGEAGTPKSVINQCIWAQIRQGLGSPHGGCWADLRQISRGTLEKYPWFYQRLLHAGVDPCRELIEVAPMPHSFSGGIEVNRGYESTIKGLFAVGEAAGGIHGACRCAGNAASQAVISGLICGDRIAESGVCQVALNRRFPCERRIEIGVFRRYQPRIQRLLAHGLPVYRSAETMRAALKEIQAIRCEQPVRQDEDTQDMCLSAELILRAALERRESRGTHLRLDYPEQEEDHAYSATWKKEEGSVS